ncbi:histone deacetylase family protein [Paracoccus actinidiae]|jgi:acetoin utilization deacetylase AcuC-like enzyme|uniref:histone deacetylase family protein n=1 Tax=Paracoccus actinidiae TaxID=3064531 RepID=UPI0027D2914D|nr:histone deacetylase family protein [Paracoccus sp. M09]
MRSFYHPDQALHAPQQFMRVGRLAAPTDIPARTQALLASLDRLGLVPEVPADHGREPAAAVHPAHYMDFLESAFRRWQDLPGHGPEVLPNTFPQLSGTGRRPPCPTDHLIAQAGYYLGDLAVPVGEFTWVSALRSTHAATDAALAVIGGDRAAYALCRPSGHHARADRASGFCYLNNAAIAAERLRSRFARVAVLDIDAHHGDGTQSIFYDRADVLTVSVHVDPDAYYPFFTGRPDERGQGSGEGFNLNLPIPPGAGDQDFLAAITCGLDAVRDFGAEVLTLALGFDSHAEDPLSLLTVTTAAFGQAGRAVARAGIPVTIIQEGGYQTEVIGDCLEAFLTNLGP